MSAEYPSFQERKVIEAAEALMEKTMAKYDPSHDAFHGAVSPRVSLNVPIS